MAKLMAILNVVAWSGFWAFGYLAATTSPDASGTLVTAVILAAVGGAFGLWAWLWIVRHAEESGYAPKVRRAKQEEDWSEDQWKDMVG